MKQITFANVKVHNEIELCRVTEDKMRKEIEHLFLKNRISYYEKWDRGGFLKRLFSREKEGCVLCVNQGQVEKAQELIASLGEEKDVEFILARVDKTFF